MGLNLKTLLVLGTGTDQVEGILEAKKLGLYTVGLDGNEKSEGAFIVDEFHKVNIKNINAVLNFVKNYPKQIDGVIAFGVDIPEILSKVAEERGLYYQVPYEVAKISKNKLLAKQVMEKEGVNVPPYRGISEVQELEKFISEFGFPVVLKPVDNSASRGVLYLTEKTNLDWAFRESLKYVVDKSFHPPLIVEKFIKGQQLSTESIICNGKIYTVGLSDRNYELLEKYAPLIIENGGDLPPKLVHFKNYQELIEQINKELEKVVKAFNCGNGTVKGDVVIDESGKVWIIEVAFRLSGGLFSTLEIPINTGINFIKKAIEIQLTGKCSTDDLVYSVKNAVRLRYVFAENKQGKVKDIKLPNVENAIFKVYCPPGTSIEKLYEIYKLPLAKLAGYVIWGKTRKEVKSLDEEVRKNLKVVVE